MDDRHCSRCFWHHNVHCLILTFICAWNLPKKISALGVTYSWRLNDLLLLLLLCRSWAGGSCTEGRVCQSSPLWACRRLDGGLGLDQIDLWFHWHHKHVLNSLITFSYSYYATAGGRGTCCRLPYQSTEEHVKIDVLLASMKPDYQRGMHLASIVFV